MLREASAPGKARRSPAWNGENVRELRALVRAQVHNASLHEDLLQDALIHFWKTESKKPGQTRSWYLKSCRFRIRDYLVAGRSIDSFKRKHLQCAIPDGSEDDELKEFLELSSEAHVVQDVAARDALDQLARRLEPEDNVILALLDQGYTICQIAQHLRVPHPYVIRSRNRIAAMAIRIGFSRL